MKKLWELLLSVCVRSHDLTTHLAKICLDPAEASGFEPPAPIITLLLAVKEAKTPWTVVDIEVFSNGVVLRSCWLEQLRSDIGVNRFDRPCRR